MPAPAAENIPDSVKTISSGTFYGCKALESVTGGAGLKGELDISGFSKAKTIDIVGEPSYVYFGSGEAETVSVPNAMYWGALSGYTNLVEATLALPYDSWAEAYGVDSTAFMGCDKLQTVNWVTPDDLQPTGFDIPNDNRCKIMSEYDIIPA